ncbi:MAG TPA: lipopolysaccharide biosynthesis protein [Bryobacteraceae bacterium]|nr:lipopolysaccharide biosynthesis protein [Bryobacteraceae bacterium]
MSAPPPLESAPPEARSHRTRRESRARKTAYAGVAARAANYLIRLFAVPLSLTMLGRTQYGLWLTVGSVLVWLGLSDLGISTGLVNMVSRAYGKEDWEEARGYVSTGLFCYTFLAALALAAVLAGSMWPGLPAFIGVRESGHLASEARELFVVCGAVWAASFSIGAIDSLCLALQEGYFKNYAQIGAGVLSLGALAALAWRGGSLIAFALVMGLPPLAADVVLTAYFLYWRHPHLRPSLRHWRKRYLKGLLHIGGPMAVVQLADVAIMYSINIMIANRLGAASLPLYAVPATAFIVITGLIYNWTSPYLSAFAEATARGDWHWIRQAALRNLSLAVAAMAAGSAGLVVLGPYVISFWTHRQVVPGRMLLLCLGLFYIMMTWASTNGTLLVGLGMVKTKAALECAVAAVYVGLSWACLPKFGLTAVPLAGCVAYGIDVLLSLPLALRRIGHSAAERIPLARQPAAAGETA